MQSRSTGKALQLLNEVTIPSPCPVPWEEMQGGDRVRICGNCKKEVYDLSALTAEEAVALVREKAGNLCGQFYVRRDGTILTADRPVGWGQRVARRWRGLMALAASVFTALALPACNSESSKDASLTPPDPGESENANCKRLGGDIPPPPGWRD